MIDNAYDQAKKLLIAHRDQLDTVAVYLIENEKINGDTFEKLMRGELISDNEKTASEKAVESGEESEKLPEESQE